MQIQFPHLATQDFRDVVIAMVPFVRHGGVTVVANIGRIRWESMTRFTTFLKSTLPFGNDSYTLCRKNGVTFGWDRHAEEERAVLSGKRQKSIRVA